MNEFLATSYYGNTIQDYLTVLSVIVGAIVVLKIIKTIVIKRLNRYTLSTESKVDEYIVHSVDQFALPIALVTVIYGTLNYLTLSPRAASIISIAASIIITYYVLRLISSLILKVLETRIRKREHGETKIKQLGGLMLVINIVIWIIGIVFLLDNMGKDVTTIITGLGIGGIAIALAAQNILGDLFNYFVIYFDRPFEVGDFIVVDDKMGTVEYLGIKTSRIRSLSGEEIVIGNSNLTNSRIHNFKRLAERRVVFTINVDYRTQLDKVKAIPEIIKTAILRQQKTRFDRSHFASYGDWALRFETVYFVLDPDYNKFMDIQQEINFELATALKERDINMVTTVHMTMAPPSIATPTEEGEPSK